MRILERIAAPHLRRHLRRRSIRLRLTAVYAGLFLASGVVLLAVTYVLVGNATGDVVSFSIGKKQFGIATGAGEPKGSEPSSLQGTTTIRTANGKVVSAPLTPAQARVQAERLRAQAVRQHSAEMNQLLEQSGVALGLMAVLSIVLGWLAAGRVLRPIRTINERVREISATSLHKRLALDGPDDELTQLASTFDDLLARLEASFEAQQQFVANASHELRTPLTRARAIAEVAVDDPGATVDSLRASHERVLEAAKQQERIIEALLTLARSERGLDRNEPFDLAAITDTVLQGRRPEAGRRHLAVRATLEPAQTTGDPRLVERLVANLVDNALRHNQAEGDVEVTTTTRAGRPLLSVANSGPRVQADDLERLFQPFERLDGSRTHQGEGIGLGLSIVKAIADAHRAALVARARPEGGLRVELSFLPPRAVNGGLPT
jgi:signal transduction histidine kinase